MAACNGRAKATVARRQGRKVLPFFVPKQKMGLCDFLDPKSEVFYGPVCVDVGEVCEVGGGMNSVTFAICWYGFLCFGLGYLIGRYAHGRTARNE